MTPADLAAASFRRVVTYMAMLLPPLSEHVNIHETCLHIWETGDV